MRRLMVFVMMMFLLSLTAPVVASAKTPVPPEPRAFGKTLSEWMRLYWTAGLASMRKAGGARLSFHPHA